MRLIVMRHGEAPLNAQGRLTGQVDSAFSALGEGHGGRIGGASSPVKVHDKHVLLPAGNTG